MELALKLFDDVLLPGDALLVLKERLGREYRSIIGRFDTAVVVRMRRIEFWIFFDSF